MKNSSVRTWGLIALIIILALVGTCIAATAFSPSFVRSLFPGMRTPGQESSRPSAGSVLLSDDFSSPGWGTGNNPDNLVEYANNALHVTVYAKNSFVWSPPNDRNYQNTHMEVTVINNGTDSTTAFGLICNQRSAEESFYYFAITPAGQYAIAKATQEQSDVFLTNDDQWGSSPLIVTDAASYRVGADCANGTLTLYVDGQPIDSVSDASYASGGVAVFTWSGEEATTTDVSFDDFLMTQLP
jgi:hypothetical protein